MIRGFLTGFALTGVVALALAASPLRADDWGKSYPLTGHANHKVSAGDGDGIVTGEDKSTIARNFRPSATSSVRTTCRS